MSDADRQRNHRERMRTKGMVDVRVDIPVDLRDKLKSLATARNSTMKEQIKLLIEREVVPII